MLRSSVARSLIRSPRTAYHTRSFLTKRAFTSTANLDTTKLPDTSIDPVSADQITTLPNGIRVATEALPGPFSALGVYIDAGSRYEDESLRGVSHIIDRLAFKSTKSRTANDMAEAVEFLGGNVQCASARESLMYQCASFNSAVPSAMGILAETIREPAITKTEVAEQLATAHYEIGEIEEKPELILPELVHIAAYKDNTLGNPLLCPRSRLLEINRDTIKQYRKTFYKPERMVVAFAGVDHPTAVDLTTKYFGDMQSDSTGPSTDAAHSSSWNLTSSSPPHDQTINRPPLSQNFSTSAQQAAFASSLPANPLPLLSASMPSHYTGGFMALPQLPPPPNPALPHLSYIHLALEAPPIASKDIYALAALQTLLGGGGSFSAGGPGKGMYSRLYTNVLNQYGWIESCMAFNHSYSDSGLFGISAACMPTQIRLCLDVLCRELNALTLDTGHSALGQGEVQRAKNQLRSSLLMNLESRMIELEDLGRQVQAHGRKIGVKEMCANIEALTVDDLRRVAKLVMGGLVNNPGNGSGAPTVVIQEADSQSTQFTWDQIQDRLWAWRVGRR